MISVAIATYNGEKYIIKQLETIKNQTVKADEVIICDDRSKDNTAKLIENFIKENDLNNWHLLVNESNKGYCLNFYDAIAKTTGDIIFLADQDDMWFENKIEEMIKLYEDKEIMSVSCRYNLIDQNDNIIKENPGIIFVGEKNDGTIEDITVKSQVGCNYIRGCNMSFRKEIKDKISYEKAEVLLSHDWMLSIAASLCGKNIYLNKYLASYRFHNSNASLSSVESKGIASVKSKRISGLEQSISLYEFILDNKGIYPKLTDDLISDIAKQIKFEKDRLSFVKSENLFVWLKLFFSLDRYSRYHNSTKSGVRIWLGDLAYAFNKG